LNGISTIIFALNRTKEAIAHLKILTNGFLLAVKSFFYDAVNRAAISTDGILIVTLFVTNYNTISTDGFTNISTDSIFSCTIPASLFYTLLATSIVVLPIAIIAVFAALYNFISTQYTLLGNYLPLNFQASRHCYAFMITLIAIIVLRTVFCRGASTFVLVPIII
jgi:hypothetical protein